MSPTPPYIYTISADASVLSIIRDLLVLSGVHTDIRIDASQSTCLLTHDFFAALRIDAPHIHWSIISSRPEVVVMASSMGIKSALSSEQMESYTHDMRSILKHNFTIKEYFLYEIRRIWLWLRSMFSKKSKRIYPVYKSAKSSGMTIALSGLIMSISLLLFIVYFAVSKTTITLDPQVSIRPISTNIIFTTTPGTGGIVGEKNAIQSQILRIPVDANMPFRISTLNLNAVNNAAGTVTLYNEMSTEQPLKPGTRLVTEDGIVYRSPEWITIPPTRSTNGITEIGSIDIRVSADPYDERNIPIGVKGNIPDGTLLTIPGLKFNRDKIYAKSKGPMVGGEDPKSHIITDTEIQSILGVFRERMRKLGNEKLRTYIADMNITNSTSYEIFAADTVAYTDESYSMLGDKKIGDTADEVTMSGSFVIQAVVYDRTATIAYLKIKFAESLLYGTDKDLGVQEDSLKIAGVLSRVPDNSRIKATVEINAKVTYDFENINNQLTKNLKNLVAGLSAEEAKKTLINDGHISSVDIRFSPFWLSHVSTNTDNIDFVIRRE